MLKLQDWSWLEDAARKVLLRLVALNRYPKRAILAVTDAALLSFALWLAMSLRLGEFYVAPNLQHFLVIGAAPIIGVATFFQLGLYRLVTRFIGGQGAALILVAVGLAALLWALLVLLSGVQTTDAYAIPRSVVILYPIFGAALVWASRQTAGWLLQRAGVELPVRVRDKARNVLIYGASTTGLQLLEALRHSSNYRPIGFVDTTPAMWGQYVAGLKVYRPERLPTLIQRNNVREVLLAMPKARRHERQEALRQLEKLAVEVRTLPAIEDVAAGRVTVSDLRPVGADDLLGRDPVPPDPDLLARDIKGKSVMVTGAGGSIGSELVRQILRQEPRCLVLLDVAEAQLYQIEMAAQEQLQAGRAAQATKAAAQPKIVAVLASVQDGALVRRAIRANAVETIYHAAAFTQVPIIERNAVAGLRNNTIATATLAQAAEDCGVERFVFISTDKAVRPSSIMGASKRLAEMVLQTRAAQAEGSTMFTMVRFGNVLDSSGSVVRQFRRQIEAGGPVTVTHRDAIRYFMSIPEAAALVIQAGAMANGGEVFLLDMGEPVKIDHLARSMIRLVGQEVRDAAHPDGDIAIEYTGLRDGETLHEELLLGENASPTAHPRILESHEPSLPAAELSDVLDALEKALAAGDREAIHTVLSRAVDGYPPKAQVRPTPDAIAREPAGRPMTTAARDVRTRPFSRASR